MGNNFSVATNPNDYLPEVVIYILLHYFILNLSFSLILAFLLEGFKCSIFIMYFPKIFGVREKINNSFFKSKNVIISKNKKQIKSFLIP